jgi:hypothetical protein
MFNIPAFRDKLSGVFTFSARDPGRGSISIEVEFILIPVEGSPRKDPSRAPFFLPP